MLRTFDILDSLSEEELTIKKPKDEPSFLEYFGKKQICYETDQYIVVQSFKNSDVFHDEDLSPIIFKGVQILNVFRSMLNLILLLHDSNISLIHLSKYSFGWNEVASESRMSFKLFAISGILDNEDEIQKQIKYPNNALRALHKDAFHLTKNLLFQNDLWQMTVFLHRLVTGDFTIYNKISTSVSDYENIVIEYQEECRQQYLQEKSSFYAMVGPSSITMEERGRELYEDLCNRNEELKNMRYSNGNKLDPIKYDLKFNEYKQKGNKYSEFVKSYLNAAPENQLIMNWKDFQKKMNSLNENRAILLNEKIKLLVEEHEEIEKEVASLAWITDSGVNYSSANGEINLVKLVTEMLKTGNKTKNIREIIKMLDEIIENANYEMIQGKDTFKKLRVNLREERSSATPDNELSYLGIDTSKRNIILI